MRLCQYYHTIWYVKFWSRYKMSVIYYQHCCIGAVRLFADVLNDVAIFLEIIAPASQQYFRLLVCTAGVSKVCQRL